MSRSSAEFARRTASRLRSGRRPDRRGRRARGGGASRGDGAREAGSRRRIAARGQAEPLAALVALLAVSAGLGLYAGVVADADTGNSERDAAELVLERVHDDVTVAGVTRPGRLDVPTVARTEDAAVGIAIETVDRRWTVGSLSVSRPVANDATVASRDVSVRVAPGEHVRGELRVVVRR